MTRKLQIQTPVQLRSTSVLLLLLLLLEVRRIHLIHSSLLNSLETKSYMSQTEKNYQWFFCRSVSNGLQPRSISGFLLKIPALATEGREGSDRATFLCFDTWFSKVGRARSGGGLAFTIARIRSLPGLCVSSFTHWLCSKCQDQKWSELENATVLGD